MLASLLFLVGSALSHETTRYHGTPGLGYDKNAEMVLEFFDSVADCARLCGKLPGILKAKSLFLKQEIYYILDCVAFETLHIQGSSEVSTETSFRGFQCSIPTNR